MRHKYIARRRARFRGMNGQNVNIPYGTELRTTDTGDVLLWEGERLCYTRSQNARDYFSRNDDGRGKLRGHLVAEIQNLLARHKVQSPKHQAKMDEQRQARWDKVWEDPTCNRLRNKEHEDFWNWDISFFEADIPDLEHILKLIQA